MRNEPNFGVNGFGRSGLGEGLEGGLGLLDGRFGGEVAGGFPPFGLETLEGSHGAMEGAVGHAHIFEASISRGEAQGRLIDDLLSLFGDRLQPVMAHLVESRKLTLDDVREAEKALLALQEQDGKEGKK
ncbi:MAG TPA: hypothetical protein VGF59_25415 [Bryobacteraceae bacterium]